MVGHAIERCIRVFNSCAQSLLQLLLQLFVDMRVRSAMPMRNVLARLSKVASSLFFFFQLWWHGHSFVKCKAEFPIFLGDGLAHLLFAIFLSLFISESLKRLMFFQDSGSPPCFLSCHGRGEAFSALICRLGFCFLFFSFPFLVQQAKCFLQGFYREMGCKGVPSDVEELLCLL